MRQFFILLNVGVVPFTTKLLSTDWWLILNDNEKMELMILTIPKDSLKVDKDYSSIGLYTRLDKTNLLDLNINTDTLVDCKISKHLSKYLEKKISYK